MEIGTGSGYQTAVLLAIEGVKVYTIERQLELFKKTAMLFKKMRLNPKKLFLGTDIRDFPKKPLLMLSS